MREAADHSCSESHQAENVSLKPYTTRWTNPVLSSALFVLGVHTAGVIVWSELKAYNTLTLFVLYKFWAFLLKKTKQNQLLWLFICYIWKIEVHLKSACSGRQFSDYEILCLTYQILWIWQNMSSNSSVEVSQPPDMHFLPECHWNAFILDPTSPCHRVNCNS